MQVLVKDIVLQPNNKVFDAIINPQKLFGFFASESSGPIIEGTTVTWTFKDYNITLAVKVILVEKDKHISFDWDACGKKTTVTIELNSTQGSATSIKISEKPFDFNVQDVERALEQTKGWTDFICSLKAYLYTGINLRNGRMNDPITT